MCGVITRRADADRDGAPSRRVTLRISPTAAAAEGDDESVTALADGKSV